MKGLGRHFREDQGKNTVVRPKEKDLDNNPPRLVILPTDTPILTLWGYVFGTREGDRLEMTMSDPTGYEMASTSTTLPNDQDKRLVTISRQRFDEVWPPGLYQGTINLIRKVGTEEQITSWSTGIFLGREE